MGYEIDYLPVGEKPEDKNGDAIAMRFWDTTPDDSRVITIDGGTRDSGANLVGHIKKYYGTSKVDIALLTHPDADHASGIRDILEQMDVGALLSFIPWDHANEIMPVVQRADFRVTASSIEKQLKDAFPAAIEAIEMARKKSIEVIEPFARNASIKLNETTQAHLLGPTYDAYLNKWLPYYDCLPTQPTRQVSLLETLLKTAERAVKWVTETWDKELLVDPAPDEVNAENNSSVIFALTQGDKRFLFCGDAGVPVLADALVLGNTSGLPASGYTFLHVPHHGSRHNLGPSLLNIMFGPPKATQDSITTRVAFVSATKGDPKHPSRRITNALNRRSVKVIATDGTAKRHSSSDAPVRPGWVPATPILFSSTFEDIEE